MRFWIVLAVAVVLFGGSYAARRMLLRHPAPPAAVSDDTGGAPKRVISMSPGLTEALFAVGAGDRVVGVTPYCEWPPEARALPKVGALLDPNYEAMVGLHPDLVVLMPSHREHRAELERLGLPYLEVDQTSLEDIYASLETLGRLCGRAAEGRAAAEGLRARVERLKVRVKDLPRPRVLLSSGRDLQSGSLNEVYVVGRRTFLGNLLDLAGGENAFPDSAVEYPALSGEAILRLNPEVVIEMTMDPGGLPVDRTQILAPWKALPGLAAADRDRIHVLSGSHLTIPGPRVAQTLEELARAVHPDADWGAP
ncbi:MAG: ABC transporter substrate-binding protein [Candidatus Hydrogenedens sp.]|nr:ABC transporter substrate-binding protein [Candidatus Hydrogenedentota bacterium]NLF56064.1 ABC transporter substrate-binding protein [Candidatus Hydrogenedens sp.]